MAKHTAKTPKGRFQQHVLMLAQEVEQELECIPAKDPEIPQALILFSEERTCLTCNSRATYPLADIVVQYTSGRRTRYSARLRQQVPHMSLERKLDTIKTTTTFCPHCFHPGPAERRPNGHGFLLQEWDHARAKPFLHEQEQANTHKRTRLPLRALSDEEI